jgi:hypothetical protein
MITMILSLIILTLAATAVAFTWADMSINEPGCPAARGLDL